jgi:hypothetical protein
VETEVVQNSHEHLAEKVAGRRQECQDSKEDAGLVHQQFDHMLVGQQVVTEAGCYQGGLGCMDSGELDLEKEAAHQFGVEQENWHRKVVADVENLVEGLDQQHLVGCHIDSDRELHVVGVEGTGHRVPVELVCKVGIDPGSKSRLTPSNSSRKL